MITTITVYDKNECDYELDVQVDYSVFWGEVSIDYIRHIDERHIGSELHCRETTVLIKF